jgi:predicted XRE-type DNA-binding protein/putative component of toxin-antitoxin plasmid stabilization module
LSLFPLAAKRAAGFELWQVQSGLEPSDCKPMNDVGLGVREIRIRAGGAWRVIYVAKFGAAVYVAARLRQEDATHATGGPRSRPTSLQGDCTAMKSRVTTSSGNVFADLGLPPDEVAVLTLRAQLMATLRKLIESRGWTQAQAADALGITQSRVSDLVRGKHDKFSLDMLVTLAARAGRSVKLRVAA